MFDSPTHHLEPAVKSGYVLTEDRKKIAYDHYESGHDKVVILAHGFFNSKKAVLFKDMAKELIGDYDVIVMDFRGHGKSSGWFTWTAKEYQDLEAVVDYAYEQYKDNIGVVGFSLGAASSIIAAAKSQKIKSLIAVSPPTGFNKVNFHFWRMEIEENIIYNIFGNGRIGKGVRPGHLWHKKTSPIKVISDVKIPVFFIHGKNDWLIHPRHSQILYDRARAKKRMEFIDGVTHAEYIFRRNRKKTIQLFREWFEHTL